MAVFQLTTDDFSKCRWTKDGDISYIDGVAEVFMCSAKEAHKKLVRYEGKNPVSPLWGMWQFPGARQRNTPVGPFHKFLELCSQLPGAAARSMRVEQAQITTRAIAGDPDLVQAILDQTVKWSEKQRAVLMTGLLSTDAGKAISKKEKQMRHTIRHSRISILSNAVSILPTLSAYVTSSWTRLYRR
jgi:hypothetical protein